MTPYIGLLPFTQCRADILGQRLAEIVSDARNRQLFLDFPFLADRYGSKDAAINTVRARQEDMRDELDYAALAVMLGETRRSAVVQGVTTLAASPLPYRQGTPGVHTAIWLNPSRPFKGIGRRLLEMRIQWLIRHTAFIGPLWTIIRPGNKGSMASWAVPGPDISLTFEAVGKLQTYSQLDGVTKRRRLYVSTRPIETLRRPQAGRRNSF